MQYRAFRLGFLLLLACVQACVAMPPCAQAPAGDPPANAGCLVVMDRQLLVVRDRRSGRLGLPGGTSEPPESAQCTAVRETFEETGLRVRSGRLLQRVQGNFHLYRCTPLSSERRPQAPPLSARIEIEELRWVDPWLIPAADWRFPAQLERIKALFDAETEKALD